MLLANIRPKEKRNSLFPCQRFPKRAVRLPAITMILTIFRTRIVENGVICCDSENFEDRVIGRGEHSRRAQGIIEIGSKIGVFEEMKVRRETEPEWKVAKK
jgi:hypothetical protein